MTTTEKSATTALDSDARDWLKKMADAMSVQVGSKPQMPGDASGAGAPNVFSAGPTYSAKAGDSSAAQQLVAKGANATPAAGKQQTVLAAPKKKAPAVPTETDEEGNTTYLDYQGIPTKYVSDSAAKQKAKVRAQRVKEYISSLSGWAQQVDATAEEYDKDRKAYDSVVADKDKVQKAFDKDLKGDNFRKLSKASGERIQTELDGYRDDASGVKQKLTELRGQGYRLQAAQAMVRKAEEMIKSADLQKLRAKDEAELKKLQDHEKAVKGFIKDYIAAVANPKDGAKKFAEAFAKDKVKDVVGGEGGTDDILAYILTDGYYVKEIAKIQAKIQKINQQLDEIGENILKEDLENAEKTVLAIKTDADRIMQELDSAKRKEGQSVDNLADVERDHPGTTASFGMVKDYYKNVQDVGSKLLKASRDYQAALEGARTAIPYTKLLREIVAEDRSLTEKSVSFDHLADKEVLKQAGDAQTISEFADQLDDWYKDLHVDEKLAAQKQIQTKLLQNKQYDFVGQVVNDVEQKGLGHVQSDSKITH